MAARASTSLVLLGAGGKMGLRITDQLRDDPAYAVRHVEPADEGRSALREWGVKPVPRDEALGGADTVVLAVPDDVIGDVAADIVPDLDAGTIVVLLDPAAAYAGVLPDRGDVTYFVTHPCHPSFDTAETAIGDDDPDWFGGQGRDEQDIVCALHQGPESDYAVGEAIARDINAPVRRTHRLTSEQMALLEPALAETLTGTMLDTIHEGMGEVVDAGVPETAAYDFLMGHLRIEIGIIFGMTDFPFSDAAQEKIEEARDDLLADDWRDVLTLERTKESVEDIAGVE